MEPDVPTPSIMQVEVTNHNEFMIEDFFDGVPVRFPKDEIVTVTPDIALHCFGWPGDISDMAVHMAKRYGWSGREYLATNETLGARGEPRYYMLARNIEIRPVYYDLVRRNPNDPIPADNGEPDEPLGPPDPMAEAVTTKVGKRRKARASSPRGRERDRHQP